MNTTRELYYFASDVHLGLGVNSPKKREERFVKFLSELPPDTKAVYLLGDIFDFWYEYKYVVPKGFTRTLGAISSLVDRGVKVYFFRGNHDLWTFGYLEEELGIVLLEQPHVSQIGDKIFCIGHGDGLDGTDKKYLFLKSIFYSKFLRRVFSNIHPRWAFSLAHRWSKHNRLAKGYVYKFKREDEPLYKYACRKECGAKIDFFIFGHLHSPGEITTPKGAGFYILGEWIHGCEYLEFDAVSSKIEWKTGSV